MKVHEFEITYCTVQSDHILAIPTAHRSEVVICGSWDMIKDHIEGQSDLYGHPYTYDPNHTFGFWFKSHAGGAKVKPYREKKVQKTQLF